LSSFSSSLSSFYNKNYKKGKGGIVKNGERRKGKDEEQGEQGEQGGKEKDGEKGKEKCSCCFFSFS
jgi:hypothetical protein